MSQRLSFIYIGTPKAGSTWMFEALRHHPDAFILPSKSSKIFENNEDFDAKGHAKAISPAPIGSIIGELAHDAYLTERAPEKLFHANPHVKIIACLREPVDFARSLLAWWDTHEQFRAASLDRMIETDHFRRAMNYSGQLSRFYEVFPKDQIQVMFYEDLKRDPNSFYRDLCRFIGVSSSWQSQSLRERVNPTRPPRIPALTRAIYRGGMITRSLGMGKLVEDVKRSRTVQWLLYSNKPRIINPELINSARKASKTIYSSINELENLIERPVPKEWSVDRLREPQ